MSGEVVLYGRISTSSPAVANQPSLLGHVEAGVVAIDTPMDLARIEKAVREILEAIGEDPDRDGLLDTPERVARMYAEIFAGLHEDPASTSPSRSSRATTRWSWCVTSRCTACASTT